MKQIRVAAIQLSPSHHPNDNLARARHWISEAAKAGAKLVSLPEAFVYRGPSDAKQLFATPIPGPVTDELASLAREYGVWLLGGSIFERVSGQEKVYNTSPVFSSDGALVARYRKIHLFEIHNEHGKELSEADYQAYGSEVVAVDTPWFKLGLSICFDLRFPELYRQLALQGAQVMAVPSAFLLKTGRDHWEVLLRARAIETQSYVIAPNCLGPSVTGVEGYGRSMIIDPWGQIMAQASDREGLIFADLDLDYLIKVRKRVPTLSNCRLQGF